MRKMHCEAADDDIEVSAFVRNTIGIAKFNGDVCSASLNARTLCFALLCPLCDAQRRLAWSHRNSISY
jgi:hypothetical protein